MSDGRRGSVTVAYGKYRLNTSHRRSIADHQPRLRRSSLVHEQSPVGISTCSIRPEALESRIPKHRIDHRSSASVDTAITGDAITWIPRHDRRREIDQAAKERSRRELLELLAKQERDKSSDNMTGCLTPSDGFVTATGTRLPPITDAYGRLRRPQTSSAAAHHTVSNSFGARRLYGVDPTTASPNNHFVWEARKGLKRTCARGFTTTIQFN